ncbi:MAG: NrfD/PsrC family molybdoenzyme membrane anchor subunit [Candidatus Caldarchaeum sp.]
MAAGQFSWDWPVLLEEFLFGVSAGLFIVAALLSLKDWERNARVCRVVFPLSAALAVVGMVTLVAELGRPERAANAILNLLTLGTSVMSRTVPVLMAFVILSVVTTLFWIKPTAAKPVRRFFEVVGLLSAFPAGMQAGILLMAASKRPLWETPVLPYLYLFTGILSAIGVVGLLIVRNQKTYNEYSSLLLSMTTYTLYLLPFVGVITAAHLIAVESPRAVLNLLTNPFPLAAPAFYIGYLFVGLGMPAAHGYIAFTAKQPLSRSILTRLFISLIIGALALRISLLYAGQLF